MKINRTKYFFGSRAKPAKMVERSAQRSEIFHRILFFTYAERKKRAKWRVTQKSIFFVYEKKQTNIPNRSFLPKRTQNPEKTLSCNQPKRSTYRQQRHENLVTTSENKCLL